MHKHILDIDFHLELILLHNNKIYEDVIMPTQGILFAKELISALKSFSSAERGQNELEKSISFRNVTILKLSL